MSKLALAFLLALSGSSTRPIHAQLPPTALQLHGVLAIRMMKGHCHIHQTDPVTIVLTCDGTMIIGADVIAVRVPAV